MAEPLAMRKRMQNDILKEAGVGVNYDDYQTDSTRIEGILKNGVDYEDKKKRYWTDGQDRDCFAIYARGLDITNSDSTVYWQWLDNDGNKLAKVVKTRWLEVRGSFQTMNLSPNVRYRVLFQLKMATSSSTMRGQTVNLKLSLPDGTYQERQANLPLSHDSWEELEAGQFNLTAQNVGEMEFAMVQLFGRWRNGLIIKSVAFKAA